MTLIAIKARLTVARIVRLMTTKPCRAIDLAHFRDFIVPTTIAFLYKFLNIGIGIVPVPGSCYFVQRKQNLLNKIYDILFPNYHYSPHGVTIFSMFRQLLRYTEFFKIFFVVPFLMSFCETKRHPLSV